MRLVQKLLPYEVGAPSLHDGAVEIHGRSRVLFCPSTRLCLQMVLFALAMLGVLKREVVSEAKELSLGHSCL